MNLHSTPSAGGGNSADPLRSESSNKERIYCSEQIAESSNTDLSWTYDKQLKRGINCRFLGRVIDVRGTAADQLRNELTEVVQELLDWATQQMRDELHSEDGEAA